MRRSSKPSFRQEVLRFIPRCRGALQHRSSGGAYLKLGTVCAARSDNCPEIFNPDQGDVDADGIGDPCEIPGDDDADGVVGVDDNCPGVPNPDQTNSDSDQLGDACDPVPWVEE